MKKKRSYRSAVRAEQVEETRDRILRGLVTTMSRGLDELSIPAVAREAGISVPTVYRHFGSKRELLHALARHVERQTGLELPQAPLEDIEAYLQRLFRAHVKMEAPVRAAMASGAGRVLRRATLMPERRRWMETVVEPVAGRLSEAQRDRLVDVLICIFGSKFLEACREYHRHGPEQAARTAAWAVRALMEAAERGDLPEVE